MKKFKPGDIVVDKYGRYAIILADRGKYDVCGQKYLIKEINGRQQVLEISKYYIDFAFVKAVE